MAIRIFQHRPKVLKSGLKKQHEGRHLERPRPPHFLDRRYRCFRELDVTAGHQEMTPVLPSASLSSELAATRPETSVSPVRN